MRDLEAQLIHDMQNAAMVLREAAWRLHEDHETMPPATTAHLTGVMVRRGDMLIRLLRDLSTAHLAESGALDLSMQRVALADVCRGMLALRQPDDGTRITVDIADDAVVAADPLRVTQVLDNLVTNARRYGGPHVRVSAERTGDEVRLSVSDDGPGVPDDLVETFLEGYGHGAGPQTAGHSAVGHSAAGSGFSGGSGLGMLIVRQLCGAMNGALEYDGTGGATFTAVFPALPSAPSSAASEVGAGHSVVFWTEEAELAERLVSYVVHGLAAGEAVLVAATGAHHELLGQRLAEIGIDPAAAIASGQYVPLDATQLHDDLPRDQHIDRERFDALIGEAVRRLDRRWETFRVFGEIVDLYWRRSDDHLALELEACWNDLRATVPFQLLCGYELTLHDAALVECHDAVVPA